MPSAQGVPRRRLLTHLLLPGPAGDTRSARTGKLGPFVARRAPICHGWRLWGETLVIVTVESRTHPALLRAQADRLFERSGRYFDRG